MIKPFSCFILLSAKFSKNVQPFRGFPLLHFAQRKIQQKLSAYFIGFPLPCFCYRKNQQKWEAFPYVKASPRGEAVNEVD